MWYSLVKWSYTCGSPLFLCLSIITCSLLLCSTTVECNAKFMYCAPGSLLFCFLGLFRFGFCGVSSELFAHEAKQAFLRVGHILLIGLQTMQLYLLTGLRRVGVFLFAAWSWFLPLFRF